MSIKEDKLQAMRVELTHLQKKIEMVPADSFEAALISSHISTLQQQIGELESN